MHTETTKAPETTTFEESYRGTADQVRRVRADLALIATNCPAADALVLLASELATNAVLHSRSGHLDGTFTVRATFYHGDYAWVEVIDRGGPWLDVQSDDEHGRGLSIVAALAGDDNWGVEGDLASRVVWFRLDWDQG